MPPLSIVILTKNEEKNIVRCLRSLKGLSNDVLAVDSGSADKTIILAEAEGAKVIQLNWKGYAETKNIGNRLAQNDWILSLDADEELNDELREAILERLNENLSSNTAFSLQRKMVYGGKVLHHGSVANEFRLRLFHRQTGKWNAHDVHEEIEFSEPVSITKLNGFLWHHSYTSETDHRQRLEKYAALSAEQMRKSGKKGTFIKLWLSPLFGFIKNYIFNAGFLDGKEGYQFARNEMMYVKKKYRILKS
jgi:hypothetical protein